ncbi:MAG: HIT domain-containing protein [Candidatus Saccharimonadales bacterium]
MTNPETCKFCIDDPSAGTEGISPDRIVKSFDYWWLVLQPEEKRNKTKIAAGMLITKRHIQIVSEATPEEATEIVRVIKPAAAALCETVGTTYTNQETVGYNQGPEAGQTIMHAHVHILPVSAEDPAELKVRGGMGGAFEALRAARL